MKKLILLTLTSIGSSLSFAGTYQVVNLTSTNTTAYPANCNLPATMNAAGNALTLYVTAIQAGIYNSTTEIGIPGGSIYNTSTYTLYYTSASLSDAPSSTMYLHASGRGGCTSQCNPAHLGMSGTEADGVYLNGSKVISLSSSWSVAGTGHGVMQYGDPVAASTGSLGFNPSWTLVVNGPHQYVWKSSASISVKSPTASTSGQFTASGENISYAANGTLSVGLAFLTVP